MTAEERRQARERAQTAIDRIGKSRNEFPFDTEFLTDEERDIVNTMFSAMIFTVGVRVCKTAGELKNSEGEEDDDAGSV